MLNGKISYLKLNPNLLMVMHDLLFLYHTASYCKKLEKLQFKALLEPIGHGMLKICSLIFL